jgi:single-stranded-DNA-specific exonuclease
MTWENAEFDTFNKENLNVLFSERGISKINKNNLLEQLIFSIKSNITDSIYNSISKSIKKIIEAIDNNVNITIFGDYDVDGICSVSILLYYLRKVNAKVSYDIPDRLTEGYGLNMDSIKRMIKYKTKLLITVDCGTLSFDEIKYANNNNIDVIVIDHHKSSTLKHPSAFSIINPFCYSEETIYKNLCAAGLTFIFILYLDNEISKTKKIYQKYDIVDLLDLVSLATIADMVPVVNINRLIIKLGIEKIKKNKRLGIISLCKQININIDYITEKDISFNIAPCINAMGRIENPKTALSLLLSHYEKKANLLSEKLIETNNKRKEIEYETLIDAEQLIIKNNLLLDPIIVVYNKKWHPGILGIVASRIVEKYKKAAIVIGENGKGSGRSIKNIDLYEKLKETSLHKDIKRVNLVFGGHVYAVGLSIEYDYAFYFKNILCEKKNINNYDNNYKPNFKIDINSNIYDIKLSIREYSPFGQNNYDPTFIMYDLNIIGKQFFGKNNEHLKIIIKNDKCEFNAIKFRFNKHIIEEIDKYVDIIFTIDRVYKNKIQILIIDLRKSKENSTFTNIEN